MSVARPVGVIGAGSFGTAIANLLAENQKVWLYDRKPQAVEQIRIERKIRGYALHDNVSITNSLEEVARECYLLFPVVPSQEFKGMISDFSPYLRPDHMMIHATKGLHCDFDIDAATPENLRMKSIKTMSELILQETGIVRVGCLAGPNLALEIMNNQPAATVVASRFDEVIEEGKKALRSHRFQVYGNRDILGIELTGVLKNYVALAAGAMTGLGYGENTKALLITRGMAEMIYIGTAMGADKKAFLGMAGIGDLIATCSSPKSRNYTVGYRIAKGEKLSDILADLGEVAEGVRTAQIMKLIVDHLNIQAPLLQGIYKVLFEGLELERAVRFVMKHYNEADAAYIDL